MRIHRIHSLTACIIFITFMVKRISFAALWLSARNGPAMKGWFCTAVSKMSRDGGVKPKWGKPVSLK